MWNIYIILVPTTSGSAHNSDTKIDMDISNLCRALSVVTKMWKKKLKTTSSRHMCYHAWYGWQDMLSFLCQIAFCVFILFVIHMPCVCSHYLFHSDAQWSHPNTDICSCLVYFRRCPFRTLRHSVHIHRQCLYKKLKLKNFIGEDDTFFKFQKFIRSKKIDFEKQVDICGSFLFANK